MSPSKTQPALLGGLAIGVLTGLPVIGWVNMCCCAWVIFGGALATYLMQQSHPEPVTSGDGAIVGLFAGVVGAVVGTLISIPVTMMMGPIQADFMERMLENANQMPPEAREMLENMRSGTIIGATLIFGFFMNLFFYSVFGVIGGIIGASMFKKNVPPTPPPPPAGFNPPGFNPPTFTPPAPPTPQGPPPPPPPPVAG